MIGHPKYKIDDKVKFKYQNNIYEGEVFIIDAYGVFENSDDVHYDIMTKDCLYKHIIETDII